MAVEPYLAAIRSPAPSMNASRMPEIELSLIIPAYNEVQRLPRYLTSIRDYLPRVFGSRYELIVVDDGSRDGTDRLLKEAADGWPQMRRLAHEVNRGKGAAVRNGMLASQGDLLLFADADGATPIEEERKLREAIRSGASIAVGSRRVADGNVERRRKSHRSLVAKAFAVMVESLLHLGIRDTQCGFKMFRREAGVMLFQLGQQEGYLFDIEVLGLARELHWDVAEVAVNWHEVDGSKLNLWKDGWRLCSDLWGLRKGVRQIVAGADRPRVLQETMPGQPENGIR
jgi:dolichyl-phosphate beta-glucosyltransferase